jgi:hypothetical protein
MLRHTRPFRGERLTGGEGVRGGGANREALAEGVVEVEQRPRELVGGLAPAPVGVALEAGAEAGG